MQLLFPLGKRNRQIDKRCKIDNLFGIRSIPFTNQPK